MTNSEDYPDDFIGHVQTEILTIIKIIDDAVPFSDTPSHFAVTRVLRNTQVLLESLTNLRNVLDNDLTERVD